ncbi:GTPase Era [bacterium c-19]|nr:GTPase Era [bacterium c-19]
MFKSGFISIIGRPNAGKSTLLNAILNEKIAITSPKPQTTRDNIMGIVTTEDAQFIFIDTPGIHKPHHRLGKHLNRNAYQAIVEADINFVIIDATQPFGSGDEFLLSRIANSEVPTFLIVNKIDLLSKEQLLHVLKEWQTHYPFTEIIPISALKNNNIQELLAICKNYLQEGVQYFPDTMKSDHDAHFQISEIIREKVLYKTEEEIPHSVAVVLEHIEETEKHLFVQAMIIVERSSQKGILIGKQASMIRSIRMAAQKELKQRYGKNVTLELYVRVENNWRNRSSKLTQLGYGDNE